MFTSTKLMISFFHVLDSCDSEKALSRIECGWPNISRQQCLARDCCYDNNAFESRVDCVVKPHFGEYTLQEG